MYHLKGVLVVYQVFWELEVKHHFKRWSDVECYMYV